MTGEVHLARTPPLAKAATGIVGLDEITRGGLPAGRPTLVCGGPGCGKTILGMEFLARGAWQCDEPGFFLSFEETPASLIKNFQSLGFELEALLEKKRLKLSSVDSSRDQIVESGAFSLDGLLIRLEHGIAEVGAKRLVLDSLETVFSSLAQTANLRNEIARLFHWLRDRGITTVVTAERGQTELTRFGFEEYISDCVIFLDHRVTERSSKRRLRVVKYRGSGHSSDEFPFSIGDTGFSVLPITSLNLDYTASSDRVSTGVKNLDEMLGGEGYFRASTVLFSGKAGTGKSSLAAAFALACCQRGQRSLYFSFEESASQLIRNMQSVRIDLAPQVERGLLSVRAIRSSFRGLEEHLVSVAEESRKVKPSCVVMDPITNFITVGAMEEVKSMLARIVDLFKRQGITLLMTALTSGHEGTGDTEIYLSSLVDTWIVLDLERRNHFHYRSLNIVKSRGMEHSRETRELVMSSEGLFLRQLEAEVIHAPG